MYGTAMQYRIITSSIRTIASGVNCSVEMKDVPVLSGLDHVPCGHKMAHMHPAEVQMVWDCRSRVIKHTSLEKRISIDVSVVGFNVWLHFFLVSRLKWNGMAHTLSGAFETHRSTITLTVERCNTAISKRVGQSPHVALACVIVKDRKHVSSSVTDKWVDIHDTTMQVFNQ